jgi:hypothetical protein
VERLVCRRDAIEVRGSQFVRAEIAAAQAGGHLVREKAR